jgi:hypothetical protein
MKSAAFQIAARYESSSQKYLWLPNVTLFEWLPAGPPLDTPACGFSGLEGDCKPKGLSCKSLNTTSQSCDCEVGFRYLSKRQKKEKFYLF